MDVHPRHFTCNSHEDRPVRPVGYTPMKGSHLRCLNLGGIFLRCSTLWVVCEVLPTNKTIRAFLEIHWMAVEHRSDCKSSAAKQKTDAFLHVVASAQTVCPGCSLTRRWIPKGMLPHFGRKIHHLHGISHTHNQQTSLGESFPGDASNKWLWHLPPEHHCSPATAPNLSLFGSSSPSMRPQLGCHPRSPMIQ